MTEEIQKALWTGRAQGFGACLLLVIIIIAALFLTMNLSIKIMERFSTICVSAVAAHLIRTGERACDDYYQAMQRERGIDPPIEQRAEEETEDVEE